MNGVLGMASLLLETPLNPEQLEYAQTIRQSGDYLLSIINDILDLSKVEAGKMQLELIPFDLRVLIEESIDLLAEQAAAKNIELACLFPFNVPTQVIGDAGRIRQILINLLGNALKFTPSGEVVVRISASENPGRHAEIRFEVTDTGIGIDEEGQKRLFQVFSQVDSTTTRYFGGTGLGLAISQRLTHLMGGQIGVRSERMKGSTFYFTLPLEKQGTTTPVPFGPPVNFSGLTVLVADDNETSRKALENHLSSWGIQSTCVADGKSGLEALTRGSQAGRPFDVVLMDMNMPGMGFTELTRSIRETPDFSSLRLVLLTATGRKGDAQLARNVPADGYLTKPIHKAQLRECLRLVMAKNSPAQTPQGAAGAPLELVTQHSIREATSRRRTHVLVAEDNVVNQRIIVRMLEKLGFRADVVANGLEALQALQQVPYQAILMDCQMPEMDGFEATQKIRKAEAERTLPRQVVQHLPIIAVTANALVGDRERCLAVGMDDYISKPVNRDVLETTLQKWLGPEYLSTQA